MKVIDKETPDASVLPDLKILKAIRQDVLLENQLPAGQGMEQRSPASRPARFGRFLKEHPETISGFQWGVVCLYLALLLAPVLVSGNSLHQFSRLMFWGIGWPLIVLSMMLFGRFWCGLFCPDGTLTEFISHHGKKRSIPRWIRWKGWPCTVLAGTTLYGQAIGIYDHFPASLVLLGIPTCCAVLTGYLYGNGKRVWCMYLCPGNGFFGFLAKLSFFHFRVDKDRWKRFDGTAKRINCAPLINIGQMQGASSCHACGRCSGYRHAVELAMRSPSKEILSSTGSGFSRAELFLLHWGIIGICTAALTWERSVLYPFFLSGMPNWADQNFFPWWVVASTTRLYLVLFIVLAGSLISMAVYSVLRLSAGIAGNSTLWKALGLCLIPVVGWGIFLGLCRISVTIWHEYGFVLSWFAFFEKVVLTGAALFSIWLGIKTLLFPFSWRRLFALPVYCFAVITLVAVWL